LKKTFGLLSAIELKKSPWPLQQQQQQNRTTRSTSRLSLRRPPRSGSSPTPETHTVAATVTTMTTRGEEEAPCASTSPSTPRWTPSTRGSRRAPPRRRRPLPLRPLRRLWPKPAPGPGAPRRTLGRPTWEFCILRTTSSSTGEERRVGFCFLLFGLTEETASCQRAHLPILLQRSPPPRKELNKNQNKKLQQQLRLQHAREAHPDRLGPAAARGRAASGERVHSPFGEKKKTKKALPRPLRRKGSPLSHRPSSCSLLQKLQNQKQVFKRIHAAFVEASCNPFYTADSVRGRGKASRDGRDSGGGGGQGTESRREKKDSRRFRNLLSHNCTLQTVHFNSDKQAIDSPKFDAAVRAIVSGA
jgi:hypothetical protein